MAVLIIVVVSGVLLGWVIDASLVGKLYQKVVIPTIIATIIPITKIKSLVLYGRAILTISKLFNIYANKRK